MKFYIETYGCSRNFSDGEVMAGLLSEKHETAGSIEEADIIIINSCTVKKATEQKIFSRLRKLAQSGKKIVVAGCMPEVQLEELKKIVPNASFVGTKHIRDIVRAVDGQIALVGENEESVLCQPRVRKNDLVGIVPISDGCLSACAYCIVHFARGKLRSYPIEEIVEEIKNSVKSNCKEIWITAQDTSAYGLDIGTNLAELLNGISELDGDFKIRVGMMNPVHVLPILDDLISAFKNDKVFKFLHLPVQSGNDEVLKNMNRQYTISEFRQIVEKFRKEIPGISIATDIIVGFPDETEKQFQDSVQLVRESRFDVMNISRFTPRPGTPAENMPQISENRKKKRSKEISEVGYNASFERNKTWVGWNGNILVDELGKPGSFISRNFAYKPVVVKSEENLFGKTLPVEITKAEKTYLLGKI